MLRVTDLDASIKYYTKALGCKLLRRKMGHVIEPYLKT